MNLLYVKIPKTGTTSIKKALRISDDQYKTMAYYKQINKHYDISFTFVRNTYTRLVSWFRHHDSLQIDDFRNWVNNGYPTTWGSDWLCSWQENNPLNQMTWICDNNDNVIVDFIGRMENIEDDYNKLCKMANIDNPNKLEHLIPPPHTKQSEETKIFNPKDYYDLETKNKVELDFKKEIQYFNFEFFK